MSFPAVSFRGRGRPARAVVTTLLLALTAAVAPQAASAADGDAVRFADAPLKAAVNAALGAARTPDQDVTVAEARTITSLTVAGDDGVSSLAGAEALTGLRILTVSADRELTDATPLAGLGLTQLSITGGALQGTLETIGTLSGLTTLGLTDDRLQDVAPLRGLAKLQYLTLPDNEIVDVTPLNDLTLLASLDLRANRIASISALTGLPRLTKFDASSNRIEDVSVLSRYTATIGKPILTSNRIRDFLPLLASRVAPESGGQHVYVGPYQAGGMTVPLQRAEGIPLTMNPAEGTYDFVTGQLTLTDPTVPSVAVQPNWTVHFSAPPVDPSITGTAEVGRTLRAELGSLAEPGCAARYQWRREGVDIAGATAVTYGVAASDIGSRISVLAGCGDAQAVTSPTASVPGTDAATPMIEVSAGKQTGVVGDPTNPGVTVRVGQTDANGQRVAPSKLQVTASISDTAVIDSAGVRMTGAGPARTVSLEPKQRGISSVTFTVTAPNGKTATAKVDYYASVKTTPTSRVLIGQGDSSSSLPAGDGYLLVADDERGEIGLYDPRVSGPAITEFPSPQVSEIDYESSARLGNSIFWFGSHGNKKDGTDQSSRQVVFENTVTGSGRDTKLTPTGTPYRGLRTDLVAWDRANGDRLGIRAAVQDGVQPDLETGFNLEGAEFSPDDSELYLAFRSPIAKVDGRKRAVIVPLLNLPALTQGRESKARFGDPILLDLGGMSIREIRKNAAGQYLIIGGTPGLWTGASAQALFAWTGFREDPAVRLTTTLPADVEQLHTDNAGAWEGIGELPDNLSDGSQVRLIMDQGYDVLYTNSDAENKKSDLAVRKARIEQFTLTGNLGLKADVSTLGAFGAQAANTIGAPQKVTITSTGSERVHVRNVYVTGAQADEFLISTNTCSHLDPGPGATCAISVRFAPTQPATTSTGQLVIESNLGGGNRTIALTGTSTNLIMGEVRTDGQDGHDGQQGPGGPAGPLGPVGPLGPQGPAGANGKPGTFTFAATRAKLSVRRGRSLSIGLRLANDTTQAVGASTATAKAPKALRLSGKQSLKVTSLRAGQARTVQLRLQVGRTAKVGTHRVAVSLKVGGRTVTRTVSVRVTR